MRLNVTSWIECRMNDTITLSYVNNMFAYVILCDLGTHLSIFMKNRNEKMYYVTCPLMNKIVECKIQN